MWRPLSVTPTDESILESLPQSGVGIVRKNANFRRSETDFAERERGREREGEREEKLISTGKRNRGKGRGGRGGGGGKRKHRF